ncbi:MAG TPA: ABC transporter ATP-binding protein [Candidatus Paceibacterota bacterium]|nr:ABC transporter ATP-binding protein [Verrucomicrobiota bacterium]HOX03318.1 ABC transporter ATP-binding protein [Verrucomicrobiota bacterium]HRZ46238.1 ABC transporter ATP-binding protein [Candidatus Paceibacterota bacterium]HRZ93575.1 ABC transporter ATP-binding protein [Candidatus Paceibacterota bacterium]
MTPSRSAALRIERLSRHFGGHRAVDEVSFELAPGSLTALIGPNGAGKSTIFHCVSGSLPLTAGEIRVDGQRITDGAAAGRLGVARTFQNVRLFAELTAIENVMTGLDRISFWRGCLRWPGSREAERRGMRRAWFWLQETGASHLAGLRPGEIPFGQQRLVEIARALARQPRLLLLDEPAAGLNRTETQELAGLIQRIHQRGVTVLLVEHDMQLVMNLVKRVLVLDRGRLIADGSPSEVQRDVRVREVYLGGSIEGAS